MMFRAIRTLLNSEGVKANIHNYLIILYFRFSIEKHLAPGINIIAGTRIKRAKKIKS